jgi:phosphoadenylyl-sulfate reductase (thioredoxin)
MNIAITSNRSTQFRQVRSLFRVVIVGHVDHGKSTLIGRLLHETGSLPDGKLASLEAISARRGVAFEWSFLLDALQTERDQGITIDTSQIRLRTPLRDVVLIDAPGHAEFLRNMITGAAQADAAMLIIDALEGVREQTRRHAYLLHLLGIRQVVVVINKMDRVDYSRARFDDIRAEIEGLGLKPTAVIPISARHGDGVARHTDAIAWHDGPTVLEVLDEFLPARTLEEMPLRLPVQAVYRVDNRRIIAGRIETGELAVGDDVIVMPGSRTVRVQSIEAWPAPDAHGPVQRARAGRSIGITLAGEPFVDRGHLISARTVPAPAGREVRARVFWLNVAPLEVGSRVVVRSATAEVAGVIRSIDNAVDPADLKVVAHGVLAQNQVGDVEIALERPIAADRHADNPATGRVVIEFAGRIAGGGLVLDVTQRDGASAPQVQRPKSRAKRSGEGARIADAARLADALRDLSPGERLARLRRDVAGRIVFTTSFGLEDQVITHLLWEQDIDVDLVTLDTGRLFAETYTVWAETEQRYGRRIRALYPKHDDLEALVARQGINGFYDSKPARLACCHVRKVEPLARALAGARAWITGLRAEQSAFRKDMALVSADSAYELIKLNPLFDQTRDQVLAFVSDHAVPVNALHAKGFASIGCAPCTRAIAPDEPERAGRWWWEDQGRTECGLHVRSQ